MIVPFTPRDVFVVTTCYGKESFSSPQLAHRRLKAKRKKQRRSRKAKGGPRDLRVYRCAVCNLWHIGGGS